MRLVLYMRNFSLSLFLSFLLLFSLYVFQPLSHDLSCNISFLSLTLSAFFSFFTSSSLPYSHSASVVHSHGSVLKFPMQSIIGLCLLCMSTRVFIRTLVYTSVASCNKTVLARVHLIYVYFHALRWSATTAENERKRGNKSFVFPPV